MHFALAAIDILAFPAGALWAWRRSGGHGLAVLTVSAMVVIAVLALFAASEQGGNQLVSTRGYPYVATGTLLLAGLGLMVPLAVSAISVWVTAPRLRPGLAYLLAVATAFIGTIVGSYAALYILWS